MATMSQTLVPKLGEVLKEEPDDFTGQLVAPNAVDACIPLDETAPLFGEMLVGLMGSYGSLLPDDINSLDSSSVVNEQTNKSNNNSTLYQQPMIAAAAAPPSENIINSANINNPNVVNNSSNNNSNNNNNNNNNNNSTNIDPFISYREESNDTNCSQHLLSPAAVTTTISELKSFEVMS
uniref:Uncharacterized protein n=1 Tax=Glossina brevipalpis TaxID=37001 RepID=A0A1A9WN14_9MUSC